MTNPRLSPPFWKHDAYTLRQLAQAVRRAIALASETTRGGTVIDLGAGNAPYRVLFPSPVWSYRCCDLPVDSEIVIEPGKPVPLPDGKAALVVSFQVLEHVWDLDWYIGEARRLLSIDGRLILSTHGAWLFHPHPQDFRRWTRTGLERELSNADSPSKQFSPSSARWHGLPSSVPLASTRFSGGYRCWGLPSRRWRTRL